MVCEKTLAGRGQVLSAALNRHAEWLLPLLRLVAADVVATTQWLLALAFCSADAADCLGQAGCASYAGDLDALEQACVARKLNLLIAHDRQFSVVLEAPVWATFFVHKLPGSADDLGVFRDGAVFDEVRRRDVDSQVFIGHRADPVGFEHEHLVREEIEGLHHVLLASELTSVFFQSQFIQPFQDYLRESGVLAHALGRLAMDGLLSGENRFPMAWSEEGEKIRRIKGWTVSEEHPLGSTDSAKAILKFWTSDLKALSQQLKQQPGMPTPRLYEQPFYKVGRYSFQFPWVGAQQNNLTAAINNLRRVNARRADAQVETRRVELTLAESLRQRGFAVEVGYQPPIAEEGDAGEVDLICQRDGVLLLMEVKSGYIRSTTHEVWLHRTSTLRKAAWQLRRKRTAVARALVADQDLRFRLGYSGQCTETDLRAWIVDTSIELDGQSVDGFRVLSREALEVVLRDEKQLLRPVDQFDDEQGRCSLFPDGFTAGRFIAVVESDELWRGIC